MRQKGHQKPKFSAVNYMHRLQIERQLNFKRQGY